MAVPKDRELKKLLDQYVCVRMVQLWGLDLAQYQFDGSLTWAVFMQNVDGTVYARYGSRNGLRELSDDAVSIAGLKKTLAAGLRQHREYLLDKKGIGAVLAAKRGPQPTWAAADALPSLRKTGNFQRRHAGNPDDKQARCIHCHQLPAHEILSLRAAGKPIEDNRFWPYPLPDELGLHLDPAEAAVIESVAKASRAAAAGFAKGDSIVKLGGQPIHSMADVQWVLHHQGSAATLHALVERDGRLERLELILEEGWRRSLREWRFINMGLLRRLLPFNCKPAGKKDRRKAGLKKGTLGLRIDRIDLQRARALGIKRGDVISEVDGRSEPMNLGAFTAYVFREKKAGDTLHVKLKRKAKVIEVDVPVR